MNYQKLVQRSWDLLWCYRALWLFGALLALTTVNGFYFVLDPSREDHLRQTAIKLTETSTIYLPGSDLTIDLTDPQGAIFHFDDADLRDLRQFFSRDFSSDQLLQGVSSVLITIGAIAAIMAVVGLVARYVAEAALIRMVHEGEETGERPGLLRGARLGFSRCAWRLFLIDLMIRLPLMVAFLLGLALAVLPVLLWATGSRPVGITGAALSAGGFVLLTLLSIIISAIASLFMQVIRRACAVERLGALASIGRGLGMVRRHLRQVLVVWLIWIGARLAWMAATVPILILLSPVLILFVVAGIFIGAVPALLIGGLLETVLTGPFPWIVGALAGLPLFLLVMLTPMLFLGGLVEVFKSSTWTLAYRELCMLEHKAADRVRRSEGSLLEAAPVS